MGKKWEEFILAKITLIETSEGEKMRVVIYRRNQGNSKVGDWQYKSYQRR